MLNIYDMVMNPLESMWLGKVRSRLVGEARGQVLEIGVGTGANFRYYDRAGVAAPVGLDLKISRAAERRATPSMTLTEGSAEQLPFADESFDTVLATLVLCSVGDVDRALGEIQRVLKKGGRYLFMEHVRPETRKLAMFFGAVNPCWCKMAGGCHLNRETMRNIESTSLKMCWQEKTGAVFHYGMAEK